MAHNAVRRGAPTDRRTDRQLLVALERYRPFQRWQMPANPIEREMMRATLDSYRDQALDDVETDRRDAAR